MPHFNFWNIDYLTYWLYFWDVILLILSFIIFLWILWISPWQSDISSIDYKETQKIKNNANKLNAQNELRKSSVKSDLISFHNRK